VHTGVGAQATLEQDVQDMLDRGEGGPALQLSQDTDAEKEVDALLYGDVHFDFSGGIDTGPESADLPGRPPRPPTPPLPTTPPASASAVWHSRWRPPRARTAAGVGT
jgi:hypothetical protein